MALDDDQPRAETQPELPPADTAEELAQHGRLTLDGGIAVQPPAKLHVPSATIVNPLRPQHERILNPRMARLKQQLGSTLNFYRQWPVETSNRSPWEIMHAAIAFGCHGKIRRSDDGRMVTAIGHLCFNGVCEGDSILRVVDGRLTPRRGDGLQGHDGQLLAILAQSKVKLDYPMAAYGYRFTVADLVEHEKRSVRTGTELTFQLIGLMHYLQGEEETWKNDEGETWSIRRLLKEEINSPIRGAACGGTHRLMSISYAIRKREQRGFKVTGQYKRARQYVEDYHRFTFQMQNPDGSFSTNWFNGRGDDDDIELRMQTTGHILEWLAFSLSDEQLESEKMVRAVEYLSGILNSNRDFEWKIGPLGHSLHGLVMYQNRVFNKKQTDPQLATPTRANERAAMLPDQAKSTSASAPKASLLPQVSGR